MGASSSAAAGGGSIQEPNSNVPPGGDKFTSVGTNPFVIAAHDPQSTFGADVDTASYDLFRRDIMAGGLPAPASVRLEEYVNFFSYDYPAPAPDAEQPFSISLAAAPSFFDRSTTLLRVGIRGKDAPPDDQKRPANLVFLVDTSGSMDAPNKLPLVKYVLTRALNVLKPTDKVSIVTYAGFTSVALPPTPVSNKATIEAKIASFTSGGGTAGGAGIQLAYQQAQAGFIEGGINHVLLCTDGDFNLGLSSNAELVKLIEEKRKTGVTLTALGFGNGNLNDSMMEAVSNKGNGVYGVIADEEQADRYVDERLLSTMHFIAKDMKIQVEFNPNQVYAYRLLGYEDRAIADTDFRNDVVDAGEVGAGHRVTALYELVRQGGSIPTSSNAPAAADGAVFAGTLEVPSDALVRVKVRYKNVDATETDPAFEVGQNLLPSGVAASYVDLDGDFQWAIGVAAFAEILKRSPYAVPARLSDIETIITRPVHIHERDRLEFVALFTKAKALLAR
jgi:Ca-activated chloride channel family protein